MLERRRIERVLGALCAALVAQALGAGAAAAQRPPGPDGQGSDVFVTIAARQCPS